MAEAQDTTSKQLCCPICLETFDSPKSLPCMHTFCEKCICKHVSDLSVEGTQSATISCPVCRRPIPAPASKQNPDDWAAKLPNNSVVLSLSASNRDDSDVPVYCEPCVTRGERHVSVAFCVTCSEYLCQTCYNYHKSFKIIRDHQITVHSVPGRQILNSTQEAMYICQAHNEKLAYFCPEHRELCCIKCALKDHRKCKELSSAEDRVTDVTDMQDIKQTLENLDVLRKMFVSLVDNRTRTLETIQQQKSDVIRSIKDWTSFIKEQLDKLETTTIHELEQICKEGTIIVSDQVVECKSAIAAIETSQRMLVESTNSDDRVKLFVTLTKVSQQLLKYLQKHDMVENRSKEIKIGFHRNKNLEEIMQTLGSLGQVSNETSRITKLSPNIQFKGAFMTPSCVQLNSTVTVNAKILGDKEACKITLVVSLPDKRIVLYDDRNDKLKLFDKGFHFVSHLDIFNRINICVVDEKTVAVSDWGKIVLVSVTDSLKRLRSIYVGKRCCGIASYQQNLMVFVHGEILIYDGSYKVSRRIQLFDSDVSNAICVSPDGQRIHYIVQDKIVTMDMNGKELEKFESDELKGLVAITVDKNGMIYCCGRKSNNVVMFTPEGRQLCVLLSGEHGLMNPIGMCLNDRNNKLLVFQSESSEIKVFTLI